MEKETLELIIKNADFTETDNSFAVGSEIYFLSNTDSGISCLKIKEAEYNRFITQCREALISYLYDVADVGICGEIEVDAEHHFHAKIQVEKYSDVIDNEGRTCIRGSGYAYAVAVDDFNQEYNFIFDINIGD